LTHRLKLAVSGKLVPVMDECGTRIPLRPHRRRSIIGRSLLSEGVLSQLVK